MKRLSLGAGLLALPWALLWQPVGLLLDDQGTSDVTRFVA
jgi:hypothetical protein